MFIALILTDGRFFIGVIDMSILLAMLARATDTKGYPDDKNPDHWRKIHGSPVHLDASGNIDGGAGGKFGGKAWTSETHPHKPAAYQKTYSEAEAKKAWSRVCSAKTALQKSNTAEDREKNGNKMLDAIEEYKKIAKSVPGYKLKDTIKEENLANAALAKANEIKEKATASHEKAKTTLLGILAESTSGLTVAKLGQYVSNKLSPEDATNISGILNHCPENIKKVWDKNKNKLKLKSINKGKGNHKACYMPDDGVYLNIAETAKGTLDSNGNLIKMPYQTFFHEFGHHIDHTCGWMSAKYKNGIFKKTIELEVNAIIAKEYQKQLLKYKPVLATSSAMGNIQIAINNLPPECQNCLSDIFSGVTMNACHGLYSHDNSYWSDPDNLPIEAFAHFFEVATTNPAGNKVLRNWLPKSAKIFDEILGEMAK